MLTRIKFIVSLILTLFLIFLLNSRLGQMPPLGKFLDPFSGIWQNAHIPDIPEKLDRSIAELHDEVQIVFNERAVPHIFARNDHDLYYAAGYVTAMHRLWQMEFTAFAGLGRISEIAGESAMEFDRYLRRIGMSYGAEQIWELMQDDQEMKAILEAYSAGVNAWIAQLKPRQLPFEYKLLDYQPEPWTPLKTCALVMNISRTLSLRSQALRLTHLKAAWGKEAVLAFFPSYYEGAEPVISKGTQWDFAILPPDPPEESFIPQFVLRNLIDDIPEGIGSNNWAVSPDRSLTGNALFAADPHQPINLPSMWYEMQLNAPGINTYGVSFPGSPFILMGFNRNLAWGNTASTNLITDVFEIELDEENLNYFYENQWHPLELRLEKIKVRNGKTIVDTVRFTHHGPILYINNEKPFYQHIPVGHAMSWSALIPAETLRGVKLINTANDFSDFREGLSNITAPPQNYAFASIDGDIGMQNNGLWPLRWQNQGTFISDGRRAEFDIQGFIPFEYLPHEINPDRGFVSSANQVHTDSLYPFFYGWDFANDARAKTINNTLRENEQVSISDMKNLQLNAGNHEAKQWLQLMLDSVRGYLNSHPDIKLSDNFNFLLDSLKSWDKINSAKSIAATVFMHWRDELQAKLWKPLTEPLDDLPHQRPNMDISLKVLFHQSPVDYYQMLTGFSPQTGEILVTSLNKIIANLEAEKGPPGEQWEWWRFNGPFLKHWLNLKALSTERMKVSGSSLSPNAVRNSFGPSWRMVAEMSDPVKAWGIYPGGQTGNPASQGYNEFTIDWAEGNYYELKLYKNALEAVSENHILMRLKPED